MLLYNEVYSSSMEISSLKMDEKKNVLLPWITYTQMVGYNLEGTYEICM